MSSPLSVNEAAVYHLVHRDSSGDRPEGGASRLDADAEADGANPAIEADVQSAFVRALVTASDTLTGERDIQSVVDGLVEVSAQLVQGADVSVVLAEDRGELRLVAASSDRLRVMDEYQVEHLSGPSIDSYRRGESISGAWFGGDSHPWPNVAQLARAIGYRFFKTIPLRLRNETIGVLSIAEITEEPRAQLHETLLRALADGTTIGLVNRRIYAASLALSHQLQTALTTRVLIEQSKGAVAARLGLTVDEAFALLRKHARDSNQRLNQVSRSVLDGSLAMHDLAPSAKPRLQHEELTPG